MAANRYREIVLATVKATNEIQEILDKEGPEGATRLMREAQLLADDPSQPPYVQEGCRIMLRGQQGGRAGLTAGETFEREQEFQRRQRERDEES